MVGEIGGDEEEKAAAFIEAEMSKPVVGYIAGFTAPPGKTMGHAGAIISGSAGTAQAKKEALEARGVRVGTTPTEAAQLVAEIARRADARRPMQLRNRERDARRSSRRTARRSASHAIALQSLAEASLEPAAARAPLPPRSEEIYLLVEGGGDLEVDWDDGRSDGGDAVVIPPGSWHELRLHEGARLLCCCVPPYADDDTFFA